MTATIWGGFYQQQISCFVMGSISLRFANFSPYEWLLNYQKLWNNLACPLCQPRTPGFSRVIQLGFQILAGAAPIVAPIKSHILWHSHIVGSHLFWLVVSNSVLAQSDDPKKLSHIFRAQSQNMEKSTKQHWFHFVSLGFFWQRASLGQVRWWSSGYRFPPATAGRPVKIQFPASATLVVARMVQKCKTSWIWPSPFLCNVKNLKISLESKGFSCPMGFRHLSIAGCSFTVPGLVLALWWWTLAFLQFLISGPLRQISPSIGSIGLPGAKGKKPWRFLLRDPNSKSQVHEFTIIFHRIWVNKTLKYGSFPLVYIDAISFKYVYIYIHVFIYIYTYREWLFKYGSSISSII